MEKTLPIILSELRKAKGISQKEASAQLGISQALLSHYEKGIRECGLGFLVRAADFYGVSCDYMLGRSSSPSGLDTQAEAEKEESDSLPITKTFLKATALLRDAIHKKDVDVGIKFNNAFALQLYRIILMNAAAGNIPASWARDRFDTGKLFDNRFYLGLITSAEKAALTPPRNGSPCEEAPVPDAIKTVVAFAENYIDETFNTIIP